MKKLIRKLIALFRLNLDIVCEESTYYLDYHDYPDTKDKQPWHMIKLKCERCGKEFFI
jgi:hypothetical protein